MNAEPSDKWTIPQLKAFLKARSRKVTGRKAELLERAVLYADDDEVSSDLSSAEYLLNEKRKVFQDLRIQWKNIAGENIEVPSEFTNNVINTFLTQTTYCFGSPGEEEAVASGTVKPAAKGRQLYNSSKVQCCDFGKIDGLLLFRCKMAASLKREFRYYNDFADLGFFLKYQHSASNDIFIITRGRQQSYQV
jgi:hypothetical protein